MPTQSPPENAIDPKLLLLYQVVGYYITRWSLVEELLYIVYYRASGLHEQACAAEFFEVDSYKMRKKFTLFAIRAKFRTDRAKKKYWEDRI